MSKEKKYGLKISKEMADIIQKYINKHPELGYRSISEFLNELIRDKVKKILDSENLD